MASALYYFDTPNFSDATAVFTDSNLPNCAADGYYSDDIIVREQINCVLQAAQACADCTGATPTPTPTATPTPTVTTVTPTPTPSSLTPTPTAPTPTPTVTAIPTPTPTVTVTSPPSGRYYRLLPCIEGESITSCYIFNETEPTNNQRYLNANTEEYFYYDNSFPSLVTVESDLRCTPDMELVPNETACPAAPGLSTPTLYTLRKCSNNKIYEYSSTNTYASNTKLVDDCSVYFIVTGVSPAAGTYPTAVGILGCVDKNGIIEGNSGFISCTFHCSGEQYFNLEECSIDNPGLTQSGPTINELSYLNLTIGDVIFESDPVGGRGATGTCYRILSIGSFNANAARTSDVIIEYATQANGRLSRQGCGTCTNDRSNTGKLR